MTPQDCYLEVRWTTEIAGLPFHATMTADSSAELVQKARALHRSTDGMGLQEPMLITAAEFCFDTKNKTTQKYECLDDEYSALMEQIVKATLSGRESAVQHYMNGRMGSYDHFNNRIIAADYGITFPDGTVRVWWDQDECLLTFDDAYAFYSTVLTTLLAMARTSYFQESIEEINSGDTQSYKTRRTEFLFEHGLWPDAENEFSEVSTLEVIGQHLAELPVHETL